MMNTSKLRYAIGSFAMLSLPLGLHAQPISAAVLAAPGIAVSSAKAASPTDADVVKAQEQLRRVMVGYQTGINTSANLSAARVVLAQAQVRSAVSLGQTAVVQQGLATIVAQRQELLQVAEVRYQSGVSTVLDVLNAQTVLAQARSRVDLYSVVSLREQSLSLVQARNKVGAATSQELERAMAACQEAQRLFAESGEGL